MSRTLLWLVTLALAGGAVGLWRLRSTTTNKTAGRNVTANMNSDSEFRVAAVDGVVLVARGIGWREVAAGDMVPARKPLRVGPLGRVDLLVRDIRLELGAGGCFTPLSASSGELAAGDLQIASAHEAAAAPFLTTTSVGEVEVAGVAQLHAGAEAVRVRLSKGRGNIRALDGTTKAMHAGEAVALTRSGVAAASASETPERALRHAASQPVTGAARAEGRGAPGIGRLLLKDSLGRDMRTLEVQELRVTTTILGTPGGVALTEIEQTFFNPAEQQAEGTFYFPVPAGASLARLAMWVGETLVEGELVERVRARHVYEEIVRRMQDPALMEWQEGNIFKTRIFPIPAKGAKRILIAYTQTLPAQDGERCYVYPLGSQTDQSLTIGRFSFEATIGGVNGGSRMPVFCQNYPEAQVATGEGQATVKLSRERFRPRGDVVLRFYSRDNAALSLAADRRAGEDGFFLLAYRAPSGSDAPALQARLKRDLVFMLDTSLSRRADDYRAQLRALRVMLEELRPDDRFALLSFDVAVRAPDGFVTATAQNINAAMSSVEKLIPLGATDLAAACGAMGVFLQKHKPRSAPDVVMLSDGIATFGKTESADVLAAAQQVLKEQHARFHALAMGTVQDRLVLSELARTSGGLFRSLAPGSAIESEAFRLALALECELQAVPELTFSGVEVTELYPSKPGSLLPGQELIVLGRYKKAGALEVSVKQGESAPVTGTFTLPDAENTNVFIPRLWAREKMETLLALPQDAQTAQQVAQLSQEFTIISPYTSFLVLENEQQYAQYGIDRRLRRRYWEEQGGMRSVPPPPPATTPLATPQPGAQPEPQPAPAPRASEEAKAAPPKPEPPRPFVETLDLTLLSQRFGDGREVATALSSLSLEVYYRYLQLRPEGGSAAPSSAAAVSVPVREAVPALENAPQGPIQTRDFQAQPEAVAPLQQTDVTPSDLVTIRTGSGDDDALSKPAEEFLERIETSPGTGGGWGGGESVGFDAGEGRGSFGYRSFGGGRRLMVVRHGGSRATESGVDYSLRWLSYAQHQNGRWGGAGVEETSLSLLALLGAGHTEKVGEYKETVRRAVAWLRSVQDANGRIGSNTYEHALGTLALSEAAGMANMPETRAAAQKATEFLGSLQAGGGTARAAGGAGAGWAYAFNKAAGDTGHPLVTAFAVLALKSAKVAGLHVEPAVFDGAIRYLDLVQADDGAVGAAGKPKGSEIHLLHTAGLGVARQCLGYPKEDARVAGAADHLLRMVVGKPMERDGLFVRYFGTLLVFQFGGEPWRKWNEWHKAERIEHQVRTGDLAGSWAPEGIWIFEREPSERKPDAAQGLAAALVKVRSAPRAAGEYVGLAQALSEVADMNVLQRTAAAAGQISPAAEVFVRTRIGMLLLERKQWDEGAAQFKTAYELSERAENVLALYVGALRQGPRPGAALDTLLSEAAQGRLSDWRNRMIATLIFDPALRIEQPRQLLEQRLPGSQAPYVELKAVVGQAAKAKGRGEDAAELLGAAYRESGRQEKYLAAYIEAARGAGRAKEALDLLLNEAGSDARWSKYRRDQAAELLLDVSVGEKDIPGRIARELAPKTEIRLDLCLALVERPKSRNEHDLTAHLWGMIYADSGRLERYGNQWVDALRKAGRLGEAREWLLREAREEHKLGAWRMQALAEIVLADPRCQEAPDRHADEVFKDRPRAQVALKLELARRAVTLGKFALAARLFEDAYRSHGRPETLVEPFVQALAKAAQYDKVARELENVIPAGYQSDLAFDALRDAYIQLKRPREEVLRAATSEIELLPRDSAPRLKLAAYFEAQGFERRLALAQYREAIRIRPEEAPLYRQIIEKAVGTRDYDFAREILMAMLQHWPNHGGVWGNEDEDLVALLRQHKPLLEGTGGEVLKKLLADYKSKDLVVVLTWDTQATDLDLHVVEPSKEECSYQHTRNFNGGFLDRDVTTGLGPETYTLRRSAPGKYKIEVEYFAGGVPTTATVLVYRNRGGENETSQKFEIKLEKAKERKTVTTVELKQVPSAE